MDKYEILHSGESYDPLVSDYTDEQNERMDRIYDYNHTRPSEDEKRERILKELFLEIGENCYLEPPIHANWSGKFVRFGNNIYSNFNLTLVDDTYITVGDNTKFGPNVTLVTAGHPTDPEERKRGWQFNKPVRIGKNCWLGAGVIVLPGVTIGDNVVVGAGSIVTKNLPDNCVAVGNPCKVIQEYEKNPLG